MRRIAVLVAAIGVIVGLFAFSAVSDPERVPMPDDGRSPERATFYVTTGMNGGWRCLINDSERAPAGDPYNWTEEERRQFCDGYEPDSAANP